MTRSAAVEKQIKAARRGSDGWWVPVVLERHEFRERDFDFELTEISTHFKGSGARYVGPGVVVDVGLDSSARAVFVVLHVGPIDPGDLLCWVWELLARKAPGTEWRPPHLGVGQYSRQAATERLATWAHGLRAFAGDVLRGQADPQLQDWLRERRTVVGPP